MGQWELHWGYRRPKLGSWYSTVICKSHYTRGHICPCSSSSRGICAAKPAVVWAEGLNCHHCPLAATHTTAFLLYVLGLFFLGGGGEGRGVIKEMRFLFFSFLSSCYHLVLVDRGDVWVGDAWCKWVTCWEGVCFEDGICLRGLHF